jgi:hypothetical protein
VALSHSLDWWAFVIAVAALFLHIPLSMLAHHYAPKVEDYLASYSRERLASRIARLKVKLAQLSSQDYFDELSWNFRERTFVILYCLGGGLLGLTTTLFLVTGAVPKDSQFWNLHLLPDWVPELTALFFCAAIFLAGWCVMTSRSLKPSRRIHLRQVTEEQIRSLQTKLDAYLPMK